MASSIGSSVGDLIFYSNNVSIYEKLIQFKTGRFTHVAIAIDDDTKIEAIDTGVVKSPIDNVPPAAVWHLPVRDDLHPDIGLAWLETMVGQKYGWSDAFTAANPLEQYIYLVRPDFYDCSALACQYLIECGFNVGLLETDPHKATPTSLANQLGIH